MISNGTSKYELILSYIRRGNAVGLMIRMFQYIDPGALWKRS